jgi:hypothetical protein
MVLTLSLFPLLSYVSLPLFLCVSLWCVCVCVCVHVCVLCVCVCVCVGVCVCGCVCCVCVGGGIVRTPRYEGLMSARTRVHGAHPVLRVLRAAVAGQHTALLCAHHELCRPSLQPQALQSSTLPKNHTHTHTHTETQSHDASANVSK